jgi:hypothetical protein
LQEGARAFIHILFDDMRIMEQDHRLGVAQASSSSSDIAKEFPDKACNSWPTASRRELSGPAWPA